jgi:hypothetical protein
LAWLTLLPDWTALPVSSHARDMMITFEFGFWLRKPNTVSCRASKGVVTGQLRLLRKSQRPIVTTGIFVNRLDRF